MTAPRILIVEDNAIVAYNLQDKLLEMGYESCGVLFSGQDAVARLPEPFREVLELRLREELSYGQIAQVLEIPVGTVRSRLHHAVQRLRESLLTRRVSP